MDEGPDDLSDLALTIAEEGLTRHVWTQLILSTL